MPTLVSRTALMAALLALGVGLAAAWAIGWSRPASPDAKPERAYLLSTASTGGTYYPVGVAIATLVKLKLQAPAGISMSAINSAGSGENLRLMRTGEVQFALLQGLYGAEAWAGSGAFRATGPMRSLRAITTLWPNVEQFVVAKRHVTTGTITDLSAAFANAVAFGKKNSGALVSTQKLLQNLDLPGSADISYFYSGYGPSAAALQDGRVGALNTPAGVPTGAITRLFATAGARVQMLSFTPEQIAAADNGLGLWRAHTIPADTYPGQADDITTIAQPNFLAVDASVSDDDVYAVTKVIFENLAFLRAVHKAARSIELSTAVDGLPVPLHPGALRYFRERGIDLSATQTVPPS